MVDTPATETHDPLCESRASHLADGHYCCDLYAVDHVWGLDAP